MSNYTPNYNDPRVVSRVRQAIAFVEKYLREDKSQWLSTRWIDHKDNFGMSSNRLSRFLREQLLIIADDSYNRYTGKTKRYTLNRAGLNEIKEHLRINNKQTYSVIQVSQTIQTQLQTGQFIYNDSSNRLYHPLQNYKKDDKHEILRQAGYRYNYDIECSAPTLIAQRAQQLDPTLKLPAITNYISNRAQIRQAIATRADISVKQVKRIINGLVQGAHITQYTESSIYREVGGDRATIEYLKQDSDLVSLQADIKSAWAVIRPTLYRREITTKTGQVRQLPISGKQKTSLYRDIERQILNAVTHYLTLTDNQNFTEHDGWATRDQIDTDELMDYVKQTTGYEIKVDEQDLCINKQQTYSVIQVR